MAGTHFLLLLLGEFIAEEQKDKACKKLLFLIFLKSIQKCCLLVIFTPRWGASDRNIFTVSLSLGEYLISDRPRKTTVCGSEIGEFRPWLAIRTRVIGTKKSICAPPLLQKNNELFCRGAQGSSAVRQGGAQRLVHHLCSTSSPPSNTSIQLKPTSGQHGTPIQQPEALLHHIC